MNQSVVFSALCLLFVTSTDLHAQEDNWWRKLFRKDVTEEVIEQDSSEVEGVIELNGDSASSDRQVAPKEDTLVRTPFEPRDPGSVTISLPEGMEALDGLYRATPPAIRGYRIQVYFGDLSSAREQRRMCMEALPDLPCYLVQNPPNFAVMLGDYRTHLDAYRDALTLQDLYPSAVVVPAAIEPPALSRE